ncbi:MAG: fibronectin type III domain-containing protein, partial [Phycisphaerae bacterium]
MTGFPQSPILALAFIAKLMPETDTQELLKRLPAITELLKCREVDQWQQAHPAALITECLRRAVAQARRQVLADAGEEALTPETILAHAAALLRQTTQPRLREAVNATGSSVASTEANAPTYAAPLAPVYEVTFDAMPAGNGANPYNNAMAPYDALPSTNPGLAPLTRLDGNGGTLIPQIVPSTGPQGGMALSLGVPSSGNVGYLVSRGVTGTNLIWDPAGLTIEMDVNLTSYTNTGLPVGGVSQWGTGGMLPGLFFYGGTTNNPAIEFGLNQNATFENITYSPPSSIIGAWHHIAGVYVDKAGNGQSRLELWIDGVAVSTFNYPEDPANQILVQTGWSFGVNGPEIANGRVVSGLMDAATITASPLNPATFTINHLTIPTLPTGVNATPVSASQINLNWTASLGTVAGYNIYRGTTPGGESTTPLNVSLVATTSYSDTTAIAGTTYYYTVKGVNTSGSSVASTETNALTFPAAPTSPIATTASTTQINVAWTAPSGTVTGYNVYRGTTPGGEGATPINGGTLITTTSYPDTGLAQGTAYYYTVKAVNAAGSSVVSGEVNAITQTTVTIVQTTNAVESATPTNGVFTVARVGTSGNLTVTYAVAGTAVGGADYTSLSGSVTILAGASTATITVAPINDGKAKLVRYVDLTEITGTG